MFSLLPCSPPLSLSSLFFFFFFVVFFCLFLSPTRCRRRAVWVEVDGGGRGRRRLSGLTEAVRVDGGERSGSVRRRWARRREANTAHSSPSLSLSVFPFKRRQLLFLPKISERLKMHLLFFLSHSLSRFPDV